MPASTLGNALWQGKCPHCRKGKIFMHPISEIRGFGAMHASCPHCNAGFEPEPGFYFGAMFVSYAINVALFVATGVLTYLILRPDEWVYLLNIAIVALIFTPLNYRYSRILWLHAFGGLHYDSSL